MFCTASESVHQIWYTYTFLVSPTLMLVLQDRPFRPQHQSLSVLAQPFSFRSTGPNTESNQCSGMGRV